MKERDRVKWQAARNTWQQHQSNLKKYRQIRRKGDPEYIDLHGQITKLVWKRLDEGLHSVKQNMKLQGIAQEYVVVLGGRGTHHPSGVSAVFAKAKTFLEKHIPRDDLKVVQDWGNFYLRLTNEET